MNEAAAASAGSTRPVVVAYLGAQLDELRFRAAGARANSPDSVHRMRVAARRLRSSMATFGPLFKGSHARDLRDGLQWLGVMLGQVRDVEVMRDHLHETVALVTAEAHLSADLDADLADALAGLNHELAERHSRAHQDLVAATDGPTYAALLAALDAFVSDPPWVRRSTSEAARHTLPALVGRACTRLDRAARAAQDSMDPGGPELHEVRKAAKRARYAAEVAIPYAGDESRALAARMEELQEVLGRHQDSIMVRDLLQELAARLPVRQESAFGALIEVERATDESLVAAWPEALAAASDDGVRGWTRRPGSAGPTQRTGPSSPDRAVDGTDGKGHPPIHVR